MMSRQHDVCAGSTGQIRLAEQIKHFCQELRPTSLALAGNLASVMFRHVGGHVGEHVGEHV